MISYNAFQERSKNLNDLKSIQYNLKKIKAEGRYVEKIRDKREELKRRMKEREEKAIKIREENERKLLEKIRKINNKKSFSKGSNIIRRNTNILEDNKNKDIYVKDIMAKKAMKKAEEFSSSRRKYINALKNEFYDNNKDLYINNNINNVSNIPPILSNNNNKNEELSNIHNKFEIFKKENKVILETKKNKQNQIDILKTNFTKEELELKLKKINNI